MCAMDLTGKVAVVYSGARGIGKAYCEALIQKGCKVYFGDILVKEGTDVVTEFQTLYPDSTVVFKKCDVLVETEVKDLFNEAAKECGKVDIVIANTGIIDERDWQRCLDVNLGSIIRVFYVALEHMSATKGGEGGDFIATASSGGLRPFDFMPVYTATKHGIVGFIRAWGKEANYRVTKMRCNAICPSAVSTKLVHDLGENQLFLGEHMHTWNADRKRKEANCQDMSPKEIADGLLKILEDDKAKGKCLIVKQNRSAYATFQEDVIGPQK